MTTIYFLRHGDVHNPDDIYYGRLPNFRLSELGRRQARAAAEQLRDHAVAAVYYSPLLRAQQTAAIVAETVDAPLYSNELLLEVHTPYDGTPRSELNARSWDLYSGTTSQFEQPQDLVARIRRFIVETVATHGEETVVAVSHGDILTFTALWYCGHKVTQAHKGRLAQLDVCREYPQTGSLLRMQFDSAGQALAPLRYSNGSIQESNQL